MDWSHMLVPKKGHNNYTRVEREKYMKHTVTDLEAVNELVMFTNSVLGNYFLDSFFGDITPELSPFAETKTQSEPFHCTVNDEEKYEYNSAAPTDLRIDNSNLDRINSNLEAEYSNSNVHNNDNTNCWYLHFDGSNSQEGARVGCILRDPKGIRTIMACRFEFECTNNIAQYEALLQGLKKAFDLKVKHIKVFDDSKIIFHQLNSIIHCNSGHLKGY